MKISRLDKIIENNVTISTQSNIEQQKLYILQDISVTLALIYDKMCGIEHGKDESSSVSVPETGAKIIPFDALEQAKDFFIEFRAYNDGYWASFVSYKGDDLVISAYGGEMPLNGSKYCVDWRCWDKEPSGSDKEQELWK